MRFYEKPHILISSGYLSLHVSRTRIASTKSARDYALEGTQNTVPRKSRDDKQSAATKPNNTFHNANTYLPGAL
ncbi:uncharacterized protein RSE6_12158 [Rhynchosporium secalis]|uniref:Uncharacterized protein n=1 Tax=Rhynchosporium secalis TaxID=38038 RepID=A0A1E1MPT2_RHYSE|nr:uncharacterized protein RSE6_12158 [Rhynchosporium secalis]